MTIIQLFYFRQLFSLSGVYWHSLIDFGRATLIYSILGSVMNFQST